MAHKHPIYDTDPHFKIDGDTRIIINASDVKVALMQGDHNSERFTFEIPRYVDGHDMSLCNICQIHYLNVASSTRATNAGIYEVEDLQFDPKDEQNRVVLSWLISSNVTMYVGSLSFVIRFGCSTDGVVDYIWNTAVHSGITISSSICNSETVVQDYTDILEQWRDKLFSTYESIIDKTLTKSGQAADAKVTGDSVTALKEDLSGVEKITSTSFTYEVSVGGFDSNTMKFNDDSNYIHSKYPIPISDNNFVIKADGKTINDSRFSVFYNENLEIIDYSSKSIPSEKIETYPYINIVLPSIYQNKQIEVTCDDTRGRIEKKIDSVNDRLKEDTDYSLVSGGFDKNTGEFNADSNYLHSNDFIPIKNNILSVTDSSLQSLTQIRHIVYYDSLKRYKTYSEFKINQEKVNQYSYAKVVLYKSNIDEGLRIDGDSDIEGDVQKRISDAIKDISVLNIASDICNYRYIMTSFGDSGKKGLFVLGSNDLKHFNLLNGYNPFIPKENVGVRDPSIAFIDGWYYIVYTIAVGVNVTNQIGLVRTKNFVEWDELPNLTIISDEYDFSNGYCWAPCFF